MVVSLHWGMHFIPRMIADYQPRVARAAFAAGADLILGHHAHVPKAIGVHGGKVCFYSLSNFIMSAPASEARAARGVREALWRDARPRLSQPALRHRREAQPDREGGARRSAACERASFLPVLIDKKLRPEVLRRGDPRFDDAVQLHDWASEGYDARFASKATK